MLERDPITVVMIIYMISGVITPGPTFGRLSPIFPEGRETRRSLLLLTPKDTLDQEVKIRIHPQRIFGAMIRYMDGSRLQICPGRDWFHAAVLS